MYYLYYFKSIMIGRELEKKQMVASGIATLTFLLPGVIEAGMSSAHYSSAAALATEGYRNYSESVFSPDITEDERIRLEDLAKQQILTANDIHKEAYVELKIAIASGAIAALSLSKFGMIAAIRRRRMIYDALNK
jgi:hypothetical protein